MSWGILKFKLPEESEEFALAQDAWKYKADLDEIFAYLRKREKYDDKLTEDSVKFIEELRSHMKEESRFNED